MITVSRAGWGARAPKYTNPLDWSRVTEFVVHYSGASRSQTVRSIQNYSMDTKGYSDIDYNALVKDGVHYVGRGDNLGGHTLNHNSISYGVCIIGQDGDATDADFQTVRELYDMACRKAGRALKKLGHQDANPGQTDCPGSKIETWVRAGMPMPGAGGDDVFCNFGESGPRVELLQRRIIRAGGTLTDVGGADGQYGNGTARELQKLVGGDGRTYNADAVDVLDEILRVKTVKALGGGKVPTQVTIAGPIVAAVTGIQ